jgi:hypothetical protein
MERTILSAGLALALLAAPAWVSSGEPASGQFRLLGSGPASVAAETASPGHQASIVGGSGAPVGISASPNTSVVAGPATPPQPTERLFRSGFEP